MTDAPYVLFSVFGLPVTAFALCLTGALGAGLILYFRRYRRLDPDGQDAAWRAALLALPLGLIGARIFYCLARYNQYAEMGFLRALTLWDGGYALWGAVGGAALSAVIAGRISHRPAAPILDAMAPAGALVIAVGRFAEYFTGTSRGLDVSVDFFRRFPFAVYNDWYEEWFWAVFMLEGLTALLIFCLLSRPKKRPAGDTARLFLILYAACQILLESLRKDGLRWLFVRVNQLTAALVLGGLLIAATVKWARWRRNGHITLRRLLLSWAAFLLCVGMVIAVEFALDGKIFPRVPHGADYLVMAMCCALMGRIVCQTALGRAKND